MKPRSIRQIHQLFRTGKLSPFELCEYCVNRAEQYNVLNAFITLSSDEALEQAKECHDRFFKGLPIGPLDGIPVAIKDNFSTKNLRTTCASNMLKEYMPNYNATVVDRLLEAGCIIMGKTNMDEFAMGVGSVDSIFGPVRNPWNRKHITSSDDSAVSVSCDLRSASDWLVCGGSSGGSAAAVASGSCVFGIGSDTGGSVRSPASHCGLVGVKPTYGSLSRHGLIPLVNSMDVPAVLCRYVDDAWLVLRTLWARGSDLMDSTCVEYTGCVNELDTEPRVSNLRIGIPREYYTDDIHADVVSAWRDVADMLEAQGNARVVECSLPHTQYSIVCYSVLCACEVASNMARYDGIQYGCRDVTANSSTEELFATTRHLGFNDVVRGRILAGNYFLLKQNYSKYYSKACYVRRLISDDFVKVFRPMEECGDGVDLLLTPTSVSLPQTYYDFIREDNRTRTENEDIFTQPVNLAGLPAVTVPVALSKREKLPIGLQLIGPQFSERRLLNVAKYIEMNQNFPHEHRPID